jgi:hypothetical protein
MSDLRTLSDAFRELERRADERAEQPQRAPARHRGTAPLVAATVVAVAALATGTALLTRDGNTPAPAGGAAGSQHPTHSSGHAVTKTPEKHRAKHHAKATDDIVVPMTPDDLAAEFKVVLGDLATFTVTQRSGGANKATAPIFTPSGKRIHQRDLPIPTPNKLGGDTFIGGALTSSDTVTGGYDLQILQTAPGDKAMCDDPDLSTCSVTELADGSSLALGHEPLDGAPDGVTYEVDLVHPDGVELLMHVSNESDPKGESRVLAPKPPLTLDQMKAVVTSDEW